jgi:hypothetical protein
VEIGLLGARRAPSGFADRTAQPGIAVREKYSCGPTIVFEQPAEPFCAEYRFPAPIGTLIDRGKKKHIAFALVIPFGMKVHHELAQSTAKRCFAEQD